MINPKIAIEAYTHWLYNADSDFIEKAWKNDPRMIEHFQGKLNGLIKNHGSTYMSVKVLVNFDRELSENHREILYDYILKNHLNKW